MSDWLDRRTLEPLKLFYLIFLDLAERNKPWREILSETIERIEATIEMNIIPASALIPNVKLVSMTFAFERWSKQAEKHTAREIVRHSA